MPVVTVDGRVAMAKDAADLVADVEPVRRARDDRSDRRQYEVFFVIHRYGG